MVANRKAYRTAPVDVGQKGDFWTQIFRQRLYERFHHTDSFYQTGMKKQFVWTTSLGCIALLAAETIFLQIQRNPETCNWLPQVSGFFSDE